MTVATRARGVNDAGPVEFLKRTPEQALVASYNEADMTEEGKFYWLKWQGTRHPALYLGETKASRMKYYVHVMKPSCCVVHKGGPKLDQWIEEKNAKNATAFAVEQAAFEAKYPPGTPPGDLSPTLVQYEAVEVVAYTQKGKQAWKVKK